MLRLRLNGNPFGEVGGYALAEAVGENKALLSLDVSETGMKTGTVIAYATALILNEALEGG